MFWVYSNVCSTSVDNDVFQLETTVLSKLSMFLAEIIVLKMGKYLLKINIYRIFINICVCLHGQLLIPKMAIVGKVVFQELLMKTG